ncbi:MAG: phosphate--acyl-ACP acyltransferase, partial [Bacteroidota bacterium]
IEGALLAAKELTEEVKLVLVGIKDTIEAILKDFGYEGEQLEIVHANEVVEMGDNPTKALSQKPQSSIAIGYHLLQSGKVDAFCGAGNTGAMHVGAMFSIKPIEGVLRPALISHVPRIDGSIGVLLDVGANTDCKPEVLNQFGQLGYLYAKHVLEVVHPKVALMNLGEEEKKGNLHAQAAHQLLKENDQINFVGNIEGRNLFFPDKADVIVCDGFTGNIVLKMAESIYDIAVKRGIHDEFFDHLNYEDIGGSPILGINGNVIIGHGISSAIAVRNMLLLAKKMAEVNLSVSIKNALSSTVSN